MKAIFIDANSRLVTQIEIENELDAFYKQIGCDVIECIELGAKHIAIVDENGRLRDLPMGFRLSGPTIIAGNALIVATTDDGDFTDATLPLCLFQRNVKFIDLKANPLPKPEWSFIPLD